MMRQQLPMGVARHKSEKYIELPGCWGQQAMREQPSADDQCMEHCGNNNTVPAKLLFLPPVKPLSHLATRNNTVSPSTCMQPY
jgi:hypothetical protein